MSAAAPLGFGARARRYMAQSGREWDPHRMSLDQVTSRQRRRLMRKERRSWRACAEEYRDWGGATDDLDDYEPPEAGYCVTPGCDCCGDDDLDEDWPSIPDAVAELERRFLGDLGNWKPTGLLPPPPTAIEQETRTP